MEPTTIKIGVLCVIVCASFYLINLTLHSKSSYTEEISVYQEEITVNQEDLPPADNVLLATGYRTGSSFFAELFNQNDDVFYFFEPDHNKLIERGGNWMRPEIQEEWANFVLDLFQCNFTNPYFLNKSGHIVFNYRSKMLASQKYYKRSKIEALCRSKKRVIKTIKPARIDILLKEAEKRKIDLRVLLYFRDARPVFLSRRNANRLPPSTYYLNIATYCSEKLKQYEFYTENIALHSRLNSLTFEELAENPEIDAKLIYEFIKWDMPANVHTWIQKNTQKSSGGEYSTSRNSSAKISEWREKIGEEEKFLIESICEDYLKSLNYNL